MERILKRLLSTTIEYIKLEEHYRGFRSHEKMVEERIRKFYPEQEEEMWGNLLA